MLFRVPVKVKVKQSHYMPGKALRVSGGLRLPDIQTIWHMKVVRLSALRTCHFYAQEIFLVLISVKG
jgi:hypothetical protein